MMRLIGDCYLSLVLSILYSERMKYTNVIGSL